MLGVGVIALTGDVPGTVEYIKCYGGLVTVPCKALIAFPLVYHYVAGSPPIGPALHMSVLYSRLMLLVDAIAMKGTALLCWQHHLCSCYEYT